MGQNKPNIRKILLSKEKMGNTLKSRNLFKKNKNPVIFTATGKNSHYIVHIIIVYIGFGIYNMTICGNKF